MTDCLLSDFKADQMKDLLNQCHKAGYSYKTLERMVRNIKAFLNEMAAEGNNPCLDMLKFKRKISRNHSSRSSERDTKKKLQ